MVEVIKLNQDVFSKIEYPKVIDTEFTQLISSSPISTESEITVDEFFELYNQLFFDIPIDGEMNSHKELIIRSTEYVGETQNTEEIDLLLDEINQLRLENLELKQTIEDLTK